MPLPRLQQRRLPLCACTLAELAEAGAGPAEPLLAAGGAELVKPATSEAAAAARVLTPWAPCGGDYRRLEASARGGGRGGGAVQRREAAPRPCGGGALFCKAGDGRSVRRRGGLQGAVGFPCRKGVAHGTTPTTGGPTVVSTGGPDGGFHGGSDFTRSFKAVPAVRAVGGGAVEPMRGRGVPLQGGETGDGAVTRVAVRAHLVRRRLHLSSPFLCFCVRRGHVGLAAVRLLAQGGARGFKPEQAHLHAGRCRTRKPCGGPARCRASPRRPEAGGARGGDRFQGR